MHTVFTTELKRGMVVILEGMPYILEDFHLAGTAQTRHKFHCKLRNLKTGRILEHVFNENEHINLAELVYRRVVFGYKNGEDYIFTDCETYDEYTLTKEQVGDRRWFIKEDIEYKAVLLDGKLIDITIPPAIPLKIVDTAPAVRGGSDSTWKPAVLETGIEIMVPLFIGKNEVVKVDTATRKYVGKETK